MRDDRWLASLVRDDVSSIMFSLPEFHELVMRNGIAPIAAHRALMLPGDTVR